MVSFDVCPFNSSELDEPARFCTSFGFQRPPKDLGDLCWISLDKRFPKKGIHLAVAGQRIEPSASAGAAG
jgi:hypothetical protein